MKQPLQILILLSIVYLFSCSPENKVDPDKKYYKDFDAFSLELISEVENPKNIDFLFSHESETDTTITICLYTKRSKKLLTYPKGNYILEVQNPHSREHPTYAYIQKHGDCYYKIAYNKHISTINSAYYAQRNSNPLRHMIVPSSIEKIIKDTLFDYFMYEDFFPCPDSLYESEGMNKEIPIDSIEHYRLLPFEFDIDSMLQNKPASKYYYSEDEVKKYRHPGDYYYQKDKHSIWRGIHYISYL